MKIAVGPDKSGVSPRDRGGSTETHAAWDGRGGAEGEKKGLCFLKGGSFPRTYAPTSTHAYTRTHTHTRIHAHAYTPVTHPLIRELINVEVYQ